MKHGCFDFLNKYLPYRKWLSEDLRMVFRNRKRIFFHKVPFGRLSGTTDRNSMRDLVFLRPSCRTSQSFKCLLGLRDSCSDRLSRTHCEIVLFIMTFKTLVAITLMYSKGTESCSFLITLSSTDGWANFRVE